MNDDTELMSRTHERVFQFLERRGVAVLPEVPFPPFQVDCYLSDCHAALEVDGPQHGQRRDERRDEELERTYGLLVFHLPVREVDAHSWDWVSRLQRFMREARETADERRERCELSAPWI